MSNVYHIPVMLQECLDGLAVRKDGVYVDVTFGGGGHSQAILDLLGSAGRLYAFDQDPDALTNTISDDRFRLIHQNFRFLKNNLRFAGVSQVDGVLADLGVSSHQIDEASRGFSTRYDADLDMRMDQAGSLDAKRVLNEYSEESLHRIFGVYGEITNAKTLARTIVNARLLRPIATVNELKDLVSGIAPKRRENKYYAQLFQALRIEVNKELDALEAFLEQSVDVLRPGGRLVIMSYHSLEDRLVKRFMQKGKFTGEVERDFYGNEIKPFRIITKKIITASVSEVKENPRARSAKLRVAEKI